MNKITLFIYCLMTLSITACSMQKEGGSWVVKKTFVDVVNENVEGAKDVASSLNDANNDLKEGAKPTKKEDVKPAKKP